MGKIEFLSAKKYVGIYVGSFLLLIIPSLIATVIFVIMNNANDRKPMPMASVVTVAVYFICVLQFVIVQIVFYFWLLVKMWKPIQDGVTYVTVGKAVGFSFIPIFYAYWWFISWGSYPREFNNFISRHNLPVSPIDNRLFIAFPICIFFSHMLIIPFVILPFLIVPLIIKVCEANNALIAIRLGQFDGN